MAKENTPEDVKLAVEHLIHTVSKYKGACLVGYIANPDENAPWLVRVSNLKSGFQETLDALDDMARQKISAGEQVLHKVERPV